MTYKLVESSDGPAIQCLRCGLVSYHPKDVEHRYCGRCHIFHEEIAMRSRREAGTLLAAAITCLRPDLTCEEAQRLRAAAVEFIRAYSA